MRCYRVQAPDDDPQAVLDEERQWCAPWGGAEDGALCDNCQRGGE